MGSKSGGGGSTTTVQKADPWSGVQPYLTEGYGLLSSLYTQDGGLAGGPQYYPGQTNAPTDPLTTAGQQGQMDQYQFMRGLAEQGGNNLTRMLGAGYDQGTAGAGGALTSMGLGQSLGQGAYGSGSGGALQGMQHLLGAGDVQNNPYLASAMQAAIRPVTQQFTEQVMPSIKQGAMQAGQMGGSRQGIAEGIASRGYLDAVADATANMGSQAYGQGLQAVQAGAGIGQGLAGLGLGAIGNAGSLGANLFGTGMETVGRGLALGPTVQQGLAMPGQMLSGIGAEREAAAQEGINADMSRWNYQQQLPYSMISDYLSMLQGAQGGTTASTMSGGQQSNRLMSGLGGAATGYGLASTLFPGFGLAGAIGGGLLGLF